MSNADNLNFPDVNYQQLSGSEGASKSASPSSNTILQLPSGTFSTSRTSSPVYFSGLAKSTMQVLSGADVSAARSFLSDSSESEVFEQVERSAGNQKALKRVESAPDEQLRRGSFTMTASDLAQPGAFRRMHMMNRQSTKSIVADIDVGVLSLLNFASSVENAYECGALGEIDSQQRQEIKQLLTQGQFGECSTVMTIFSMLKSMIGAGVLMIPAAFHYGGWAYSAVALTISCALNYFSNQLLCECHDRHQRPYASIARHVLGDWSFPLVSGQITLTCFCFIVVMSKFIAQTSMQVFEAHGVILQESFVYLCIFCIFAPLCSVRTLTNMQLPNKIGSMIQLSAIGFVTYAACSSLYQNGIDPNVEAYTGFVSGAPFIGTTIYAFEGVAAIIPVKNAMQYPRSFMNVVRFISFLLLIVYGLIGVLGYLAWGPIQAPVAINAVAPSTGRTVFQLAYCFALIMSFPVQAFPCFAILEKLLLHHINDLPIRKHRRVSMRIIVAGIGVWVAFVFKDLQIFASLVGVLCNSPLIFIYPPLIHRKLYPEHNRIKRFLVFWAGVLIMPLVAAMDVQTFLAGE